MKRIKLTKASNFEFEEMRTIETLEQLEQIQEEFKSELIVRFTSKQEQEEENIDIDIIIYDDYVE